MTGVGSPDRPPHRDTPGDPVSQVAGHRKGQRRLFCP